MLDLKRLKILREVAQRGSFSAAGESLYLSQSAVSQQVATLEREVGMQLLDRTREGPKLTDAGQVLVAHAEAAIARLEEAERELAAIAGLEGGELRMASFPAPARRSSPRPSPAFTPATRRSGSHRRRRARGVAAGLRAGELDLALSSTTPRSRRRASATSTGRSCSPSRCTWRSPRTIPWPREPRCRSPSSRTWSLARRLAAEHLRRGRDRGLPHARASSPRSASSPMTTT